MTKPPWTPEQVEELNVWQKHHPLVCGSGRRTDAAHLDGEGILVATPNGWMCPYCNYRQSWVSAEPEPLFDGHKVLMRFAPLPPHPEEMNPDCPDEFAVVELAASDPAGLMLWQRRGDKWEANAHWCYRHAVRWFMAELSAIDKSIMDRGVCERDCTLPLAQRVDNLIVDLRTEEHEWATQQVRMAKLQSMLREAAKHLDTLVESREERLYPTPELEELIERIDKTIGKEADDADQN